MRIFIEDSFDSAHYLPHVLDGHPCGRMHGHTYRVRIEVEGPVHHVKGWVIDYTDVKKCWEPIKRRLDHQTLNEVAGLQNPTCEHIAQYIWGELSESITGLCRIELRETERCGVVYEGAAF
jgi:6-pyruvoyltetrahydropterin/6-carboxytetrahydropterin synthase